METQAAARGRLIGMCVLNAQLRGTPQGFGLRRVPVFCASRDERLVSFAASESLASGLEACLSDWEAGLAAARGLADTAAACARFWLAFIALHPFVDKNGETARQFLVRELGMRKIRIRSFDWLQRCLIEGRIKEDLRKLECAFLLGLDPRSPGFQETRS